jgi:hypothetical protein
MSKKQTLNEQSSRIKQIMGLTEGELYFPDDQMKAREKELQTVPGVIEYLKGISQKIEYVTRDLEKIYGETSYWHYIEPMFSGLKSVSDMEGFHTNTENRQENVKNIIDRIDSDFNEDLSRYDDNESDMNEQYQDGEEIDEPEMDGETPLYEPEMDGATPSTLKIDSSVHIDTQEFTIFITSNESQSEAWVKVSVRDGGLMNAKIINNEARFDQREIATLLKRKLKEGMFENFPNSITWDMESDECSTNQ